jgi:hypothetical protein
MMPATLIPKRYEAAKRSWYMAALANRDSNGDYSTTISTPYLDANGAGEVITMSRAITRGGSTNSDPVAGVVGVDFKLSYVKGLVDAALSSNGITDLESVRAVLIDETGHVVYHRDFVDTIDAEEHTFLSAISREVTQEMIDDGHLTQSTCMDYASGTRKTAYSVDLVGGAITVSGTNGCGDWALTRVGKSNIYLLAMSSNGCSSSTADCTPCNEDNCKNATWSTLGGSLLCQPCQCKVEYDSCELNYGQPAIKLPACPTSPPPLFTDLCPSGDYKGDNDDGFNNDTLLAFLGFSFMIFIGFTIKFCFGKFMGNQPKVTPNSDSGTNTNEFGESMIAVRPTPKHIPIQQVPSAYGQQAQVQQLPSAYGQQAQVQQVPSAYGQQAQVHHQQLQAHTGWSGHAPQAQVQQVPYAYSQQAHQQAQVIQAPLGAPIGYVPPGYEQQSQGPPPGYTQSVGSLPEQGQHPQQRVFSETPNF